VAAYIDRGGLIDLPACRSDAQKILNIQGTDTRQLAPPGSRTNLASSTVQPASPALADWRVVCLVPDGRLKMSGPRAYISRDQRAGTAPTRFAVATIFRAALEVTTIGPHDALTPRVRARTTEDPRR